MNRDPWYIEPPEEEEEHVHGPGCLQRSAEEHEVNMGRAEWVDWDKIREDREELARERWEWGE